MFLELQVLESTNPVQINTTNISSINGHIIKMNNCDILTLTDESFDKLVKIVSPKTPRTKNNEPKPELQELFDKLHLLTGGKGKALFNPIREKKLKALLTTHRMTKEDLIRAATNIGKDAFLQGDNENKKRWGDVDYLLRPDRAAKWADQTPQENKKRMF